MRSPLSICIFYQSDALARSLLQYLRGTPPGEQVGGRYTVTQFNEAQGFLNFVVQRTHHVDCLVLQDDPVLPDLLEQLKQLEIFFPIVLLQTGEASDQSQVALNDLGRDVSAPDYFSTVLSLETDRLSEIRSAIDQAISKFIQIAPHQPAQEADQASSDSVPFPTARSLSLKAQQLRLAEKLKERLGYLGVYYKRNPQNFLRHMSSTQQDTLLRQLQAEYREIILTYFSDEANNLNQKIDDFVNVAFFADIPVAQIVEIHMDLMDEFSKQLKLEGRSDDILQDYRLTLIDTIAHLCEMYRRSIPRES
ncbi:circadian clock protein KaiA [Egbenema bharatensis]|uniref:circadian clock protein KaiA n=1 Tax=Egbenema bharatensis TaxID=3463334 RepID=UPI003A894F0E